MKNRIGCLFVVLVVLIVGYDQWRIQQLQNEVRAISGKVQSGEGAGRPGAQSDLLTALAEAERHAKKAKELIDKKRTSQAQAELDKALKSLRSANDVSEDIIGDVAEALGKARDNAVRVFQRAWKDISEEAKSTNGRVEMN